MHQKQTRWLSLWLQYLKYSLCTTGDNILLSDELKQIESYFNMLKIKYEDAFTYSITAKKEIDMLRIPSHILFPFLDRAASLITVNTGHLDIAISISCENGYTTIDIVSDYNPDNEESNPASSFKNFRIMIRFALLSAISDRDSTAFLAIIMKFKESYQNNSKIHDIIKLPISHEERIM